MANTERLAALVRVRTARNAVQAARARTDLSDSEQSTLITLFADLDELEDTLILDDLSESIDAIKRDSDDLKGIVDAAITASGKLAKELALVDAAEKAVSGLAGLVSMAVSHGLI